MSKYYLLKDNSVKKDKTPVVLKIIRWIFPKMEAVVPRLAQRLFIRIFFSPIRYAIPEKEILFQQRADRFEVFAGSKRVQCYSWGEGPVVLVVHGWAGRATQFRKFIETLTENGFRVVGFDGPAHGNSDGRSTNILEFEVTFRKIYEKVGEPRAIIAHSFGGAAVLFAAMRGLKVSKLINIASPTIGDKIINTYLTAIRGSWKISGNYFKAYILKKYGKPFDEFTSLHFIKNLNQQTALLLVHDEDDQEVTIDHPKALMEIHSQTRLFKTKGLGHTRILKDQSVIDQCVTFIRE